MMATETIEIEADVWHECYSGQWKGLIVDEAFAHPAKIARDLARRIYDHAFAEGWLVPGSVVVDPFGGICGTALDAACRGMLWIGVELEEKFFRLGNENIAKWRGMFGHWPEWVTPHLVQGDSRQLCERMGEAARAIIGSPPFVDARQNTTASVKGNVPTQHDPENWTGAVIGSPPYAESTGVPSLGSVNKDDWGNEGTDIAKRRGLSGDYGSTPGQLGELKEGDLAAAVVLTSPPYEGNQKSDYLTSDDGKTRARDERRGFTQGRGCFRGSESAYGETEGQLGREESETFWTAARLIVEQCFRLLRPGGHAIWVCKDYVKKDRIVPFCRNWQMLCEACGFRTVCVHRASLVKQLDDDPNLFGKPVARRKERKSFFRRLAEKKGSPRIDWEEVICMEKPA